MGRSKKMLLEKMKTCLVVEVKEMVNFSFQTLSYVFI